MRKDHTAAIRCALEADGWSFDRIIPSATLPIMTSAGGREANASLVTPGYVHWTYYSEGNDVLSNMGTWIPSSLSEDQVRVVIAKALTHVRRRIDDSFARRLYLRYPTPEVDPKRCEWLENVNACLAKGERLVITDPLFVWFIRPDGDVRWMERFDESEMPSSTCWSSNVGTLPVSHLEMSRPLPIEDLLIDKYQAVFPALRIWLTRC